MSLISLLFALAAERYLSSSSWQFNSFYKQYLKFTQYIGIESPWASTAISFVFVFIPVCASYILLNLVDNSLLHLILSTIILIVCFGCVTTRDTYKKYLMSAFRGEKSTCERHHAQLLKEKNLQNMSFGHLLIWLNYRYFIAVMIFFVLFGAPGALFYRLLTRTTEQQNTLDSVNDAQEECNDEPSLNLEQNNDEQIFNENQSEGARNSIETLLFWLDWLPVRMVAFGYMLVGHFSKALPTWLENFFEIDKASYKVLFSVAEKSEDVMIEVSDCTSEPCLLVRLAKRTLLLCLAIISLLILTGFIS